MSEYFVILVLALGAALNSCLPEIDFCRPENKITTNEQALAFAKQQIALRSHIAEEAGFNSVDDYIAAIEVDPNCCSVRYGQRSFEGAGKGWSVMLSAEHLPNRYDHEIEFSRCKNVSYNGGISYK